MNNIIIIIKKGINIWEHNFLSYSFIDEVEREGSFYLIYG